MFKSFSAYFNGRWMPSDECTVSINDRGFTLGDGVFEIERTFNGKIFDLDGHLDRLFRSLKHVRIDPGLTQSEMAQISEEAIHRNWSLVPSGGDMQVTQRVTRGIGRSAAQAGPSTVYIGGGPLDFGRFANLYDVGCHVVFAKTRAHHPSSLDPKVKHQSRMNFVLADLEANDIDPNSWPAILDLDGNVAEGIGFNIWIVADGVLKSPDDKTMLQGISRKNILELASQLDIPVVTEDIQMYDVYNADEVFISVTSPCILPVSKIDSRPLEGNYPGPVASRLLSAWSEKIGIDIIEQCRAQVALE